MAVAQLVVAYDVSDNGRRSRLAAFLSGRGVRLQKSVFQCEVESGMLDEFIEALEGYIDERVDTLHGFLQCQPCQERIVRIGQTPADLDVEFWIV